MIQIDEVFDGKRVLIRSVFAAQSKKTYFVWNDVKKLCKLVPSVNLPLKHVVRLKNVGVDGKCSGGLQSGTKLVDPIEVLDELKKSSNGSSKSVGKLITFLVQKVFVRCESEVARWFYIEKSECQRSFEDEKRKFLSQLSAKEKMLSEKRTEKVNMLQKMLLQHEELFAARNEVFRLKEELNLLKFMCENVMHDSKSSL